MKIEIEKLISQVNVDMFVVKINESIQCSTKMVTKWSNPGMFGRKIHL